MLRAWLEMKCENVDVLYRNSIKVRSKSYDLNAVCEASLLESYVLYRSGKYQEAISLLENQMPVQETEEINKLNKELSDSGMVMLAGIQKSLNELSVAVEGVTTSVQRGKYGSRIINNSDVVIKIPAYQEKIKKLFGEYSDLIRGYNQIRAFMDETDYPVFVTHDKNSIVFIRDLLLNKVKNKETEAILKEKADQEIEANRIEMEKAEAEKRKKEESERIRREAEKRKKEELETKRRNAENTEQEKSQVVTGKDTTKSEKVGNKDTSKDTGSGKPEPSKEQGRGLDFLIHKQ
jgi:hypothetical protein